MFLFQKRKEMDDKYLYSVHQSIIEDFGKQMNEKKRNVDHSDTTKMKYIDRQIRRKKNTREKRIMDLRN